MIRWTTGSELFKTAVELVRSFEIAELFPIPTVDLINRVSLFNVNMLYAHVWVTTYPA
jgi:hypothetical protein